MNFNWESVVYMIIGGFIHFVFELVLGRVRKKQTSQDQTQKERKQLYKELYDVYHQYKLRTVSDSQRKFKTHWLSKKYEYDKETNEILAKIFMLLKYSKSNPNDLINEQTKFEKHIESIINDK